MYCNYFGFKERPFEVSPDPEFLYLSSGHREMLAALVYGIQERRGLIAIIGEVGTGKTTLLRTLMGMVGEEIRFIYFFSCGAGFKDFINTVLMDLGLSEWNDSLNITKSVQSLYEFAKNQYNTGGNLVLILDEAQNLDRDFMENLRLLSNFEIHKQKLIQIILSGQVELDEKLKRYDLRQMAQRINMRRHIIPLSRKDTYDYINHRIALAGYSGPSLFSNRALMLIRHLSGGIPRKINMLCDNALLNAFGLNQKQITSKIIREVAGDLYLGSQFESEVPSGGKRDFFHHKAGNYTPWIVGVGLFAGAFIVASFFWAIWPFLQANLPSPSIYSQKIESSLNKTDDIRQDEPTSPGSFSESPSSTDQNIEKNVTQPPKDTKMKEGTPTKVHKVKIKSEDRIGDAVPAPSVAPRLDLNSESKTAGNNHINLDELLGFGSPVTPGDHSWALNSSSNAEAENFSYVIVKPGENLTQIIQRHYGAFDEKIFRAVLEANESIPDANLIKIGQKIKLPKLHFQTDGD